jgi:hypothetical protein
MAQRWSRSLPQPLLRHDISTSIPLSFREHADVLPWGRVIREPQLVANPRFVDGLPALVLASGSRTKLAFGLRLSYGDSCLTGAGAPVDMPGPGRFVSFDSLTCSLADPTNRNYKKGDLLAIAANMIIAAA